MMVRVGFAAPEVANIELPATIGDSMDPGVGINDPRATDGYCNPKSLLALSERIFAMSSSLICAAFSSSSVAQRS